MSFSIIAAVVICAISLSTETEHKSNSTSSSATHVTSPTNMPLRLRLTLADGMQIIGVPSIKSLPLKTSYADLLISLDRIRSAEFSNNHTDVLTTLVNGDRVTATLKLSELQLTTIFGKVSVESRHICKITVVPSGQSGQWPHDGLWGYWPLDGDTKDASGNGHDGEIKGAVPVKGVRNQGYSFNGNACIEVGNPDFSNEEYTVSVWMRTENPADQNTFHSFLDKLQEGPGGPFEFYLCNGRTVFESSNGPGFITWLGGEGVVNMFFHKEANFRDGRWHHCAATYKNGEQKFYADGELIETKNYTGKLPVNSTPVAIGGHSFGPYHRPWIGDIDEVFIYQRALSEDEVQTLYSDCAQ